MSCDVVRCLDSIGLNGWRAAPSSTSCPVYLFTERGVGYCMAKPPEPVSRPAVAGLATSAERSGTRMATLRGRLGRRSPPAPVVAGAPDRAQALGQRHRPAVRDPTSRRRGGMRETVEMRLTGVFALAGLAPLTAAGPKSVAVTLTSRFALRPPTRRSPPTPLAVQDFKCPDSSRVHVHPRRSARAPTMQCLDRRT